MNQIIITDCKDCKYRMCVNDDTYACLGFDDPGCKGIPNVKNAHPIPDWCPRLEENKLEHGFVSGEIVADRLGNNEGQSRIDYSAWGKGKNKPRWRHLNWLELGLVLRHHVAPDADGFCVDAAPQSILKFWKGEKPVTDDECGQWADSVFCETVDGVEISIPVDLGNTDWQDSLIVFKELE